MTEALEQLKEDVQRCAFSDPKSSQTLRYLIRQIIYFIQHHYKAGEDPMAMYDILQRFQQAERHLHVFKPIDLNTSGGEHHKRAFDNAKADTIYLFSLLQSAIRFGHVLPLSSKQKA